MAALVIKEGVIASLDKVSSSDNESIALKVHGVILLHHSVSASKVKRHPSCHLTTLSERLTQPLAVNLPSQKWCHYPERLVIRRTSTAPTNPFRSARLRHSCFALRGCGKHSNKYVIMKLLL